MRWISIVIITCSLLLSSAVPSRSEGTGDYSPNISFGLSGTISGVNVLERKKGQQYTRFNFTPAYGGGFVFEKMFTNLIGIQSGLYFSNFNLHMRIRPGTQTPPFGIDIKNWNVSVPVSLVLSLNTSIFSFQILPGIKYTHFVQSKLSMSRYLLAISLQPRGDSLPQINQPQLAFTLGINFKFRVHDFVDYFVGGSADMHVTNFLRWNDSIELLYSFTATTGVMFRTNLFPMEN